MRLKTFFIILALLIFFSTCKSPESPEDQITNGDQTPTTGTISGTVTDVGTATPLVGASVSTQPATTTATTGAQGTYTISNVSPGSYTVTASVSDYVEESVSVTVTAGQTATANLALQADYSGSWSGTTSQGYNISFTVVDNAIPEITFGFKTVGPICTASGTLTIHHTPSWLISGNTFTISGTVSDMSYTFNGTFDSPTTASGTAEFTSGGMCSGTGSATWAANKN